ncbi:YXWGXW repeat-containing protein, partial [candidate division KSB1 bacterium]|nr:YXWGXW repeat-containing protein [candidate division KSB1 bacterium]
LKPRHGYVYVQPRWKRNHHGYYYVAGHWKRV